MDTPHSKALVLRRSRGRFPPFLWALFHRLLGRTWACRFLSRRSLSMPRNVLRRARLAASGASPRPTRHPIVLAHGYLGFGAFAQHALAGRYFRGVRELLESLGCEVYVLDLPATASVAVRADALARQIDALSVGRVNIVAHSMGGLDARYALAKLGLSSHVASLTTLGTPHRGTPLADLLERSAPGAAGDGLADLTTDSTTAFNDAVPDADGVFYGSVVGATSTVSRVLAPAHETSCERRGPMTASFPHRLSRGVTCSARWTRIDFAQIGWARRFDLRALYGPLVTHLASFGL